jgi:DNA-binding transcriptional ArsR family regulator
MVEQTTLNNIFRSLADPTRRDILSRLLQKQYTIGELVDKYDISFAAVAKHINVLESAHLISKKRQGKERIITINGRGIEFADAYLQHYAALWSDRYDRLEDILNKEG